MSVVAVLVFLVVIGTIGAVMLLTALIDRAPQSAPLVAPGVAAVPAQRDGSSADAVEPEAGGVR
jgi:hypothetical protein